MRYVSLKTSDVMLIQEGKKSQLILPVKFPSKFLMMNPGCIDSASPGDTFAGFPTDLFWFINVQGDGYAYVTPVCVPFEPNETIFVKETWNHGYIDVEPDNHFSQIFVESSDEGQYVYKADFNKHTQIARWRRSVEMPNDATRFFLKIQDVYPKRLHELTQEEICDEGYSDTSLEYFGLKKWNFRFDKRNRNIFGYHANPWVWILKFQLES